MRISLRFLQADQVRDRLVNYARDNFRLDASQIWQHSFSKHGNIFNSDAYNQATKPNAAETVINEMRLELLRLEGDDVEAGEYLLMEVERYTQLVALREENAKLTQAIAHFDRVNSPYPSSGSAHSHGGAHSSGPRLSSFEAAIFGRPFPGNQPESSAAAETAETNSSYSPRDND